MHNYIYFTGDMPFIEIFPICLRMALILRDLAQEVDLTTCNKMDNFALKCRSLFQLIK